MLLATAAHVCDEARRQGVAVDDYIAAMTPADLALLVVGWGTLRVSPYDPAREEKVATLRASAEVGAAAHAVLSCPAAAEWRAPLDLDRQVWVSPTGEPPTRANFATPATLFPALATKPLGGFWTSTRLPGLDSVWLTREPMDSATPPPTAKAVPMSVAPGPPVRAYEIGSREDWVALCDAYPEDTTTFYGQDLRNAALSWSPPFITPEWRAVREAFDAVHLSWHGYVDATYEVVPVLGGTTCLAGWASESTLWLQWVFPDG